MITHPELSTKVISTHVPDSYAANTHVGSDADTLGYDHAMVVVHKGAVAAGGTVNVKIQEKDVGGVYADALDDADTPAAIALPEIDENTTQKVFKVLLRLDRRKRVITPVAVVADAAAELATEVVLLNARDSKFADQDFDVIV